MKQLKWACFTFLGITLISIIFQIIAFNSATDIKMECEALYYEENINKGEYLRRLYLLEEKIERHAFAWDIIINHTETYSIISLMNISIAYAENDDIATSKVNLSSTVYAINQMLDREKILFWNIF